MLRQKDSSLKCEASLKIAPPHLIFVLFLALLGTCARIYFDLLGVLGAVTEKSATRRNNCQSACNFHNRVDNTKCTLKKTQLPWKIRPHRFGCEGVLIGGQTATLNAQSNLLIQQSLYQL